ncbi:MAG: FtsQ-type POTRA domain-containing protein [Clostridia bacterium]|nr:FtsQ-type POTRA domain-containing protein [Clostridia bacterium]
MKKKRGKREQTSFLFDKDAGTEPTIDLFGDDESAPQPEPEYDAGEPDAPEPVAAPEADEPAAASQPIKTEPSFRFDRYGRRIGKKNARYGKRKNVPKATTTVVEHDTEAKREYDEARKRAEIRAKKRAKEEAMQAALKKAERKKKRRRSASTFVLAALALAGLLGLTWFITRVSKVVVTNVPAGYTEERIVELSGLDTKIGKKSALLMNMSDIEKEIRSNDPYLDATVRYSFPSTIRITVSKRAEAACVRWGPQKENYAIIDENGTVLNAEAESVEGLLIADGMNISSAVNGARLGDSSDIQVAALIRLLQKLKELDLLDRTPRISRIDMTELMQIRMDLEGVPYTIEIGDTANLETWLGRLQKHWNTIMDDAASLIRSGYSTVTIYLYSKGGITVSPFEPGYAIPTLAPATPKPADPNATPTEPGDEPQETPSDEPTDEPSVATPMPHQNDPFTG